MPEVDIKPCNTRSIVEFLTGRFIIKCSGLLRCLRRHA